MSRFFLALIAYGLLVQAGLVSGAAVRLRVLTVGADKCSPTKVTKIETAIGEAIKLADAAIKALANPQVVNSQAFIDFLGQGNDPKTLSAEKFLAVKEALGGQLDASVAIGTGSKDVTFICPPDKEDLAATPLLNPLAPNSAEKCVGTLFAIARNGPPSVVRMCPMFFETRLRVRTLGQPPVPIEPKKLQDAADLHKEGDRMGSVPGMVLFHEFQHLEKAVGPNFARDLEANVDPLTGPPPPPVAGAKQPTVKNPAYSANQCKSLSPNNKILNAQNFAWFAMDVFAVPARGLPCGAPASPVASGSGSGTSPPGSPKPPVKPIARRATTTASKATASKVAKPKKVSTPAAPKKVVPPVAAPAKVAKPVTAPVIAKPVAAKPVVDKPVVATPNKVTPPANPKKVTAPIPIIAKPKTNPLGGGVAPSGPRLARPARLSSSATAPAPTKVATGTGAKKGASVGTGGTIGGKKPAPIDKASPAFVCTIALRGIVEQISADGAFVG